MQLTEEQKKAVRQWVSDGASLSDIQKKIGEEFKIPVTFMDVRFLVLDLKLAIKEKKSSSGSGVDLSKAPPPAAGPDEADLDEPEGPPGNVRVELDRVVKAGALASGSARFSDGETVTWSLDQFGRLAAHVHADFFAQLAGHPLAGFLDHARFVRIRKAAARRRAGSRRRNPGGAKR